MRRQLRWVKGNSLGFRVFLPLETWPATGNRSLRGQCGTVGKGQGNGREGQGPRGQTPGNGRA